MKRVLLFLILLVLPLISIHIVSANHELWHSHEPIVVRVTEANQNLNYQMGCRVPSGFSQTRTITIRAEDQQTEFETQINQENFNYQFQSGKLYHIGCQATNLSNGQLMRGDFHIDINRIPNPVFPKINVTQTNGDTFTASCTYSGSNNFNLQWSLIQGRTGQTIHLNQFNNQQTIQYDLSEPGVWDIICGVWDNTNNVWRQSGLPVEFFQQGPAYLPNPTGCLPLMSCNNQGNEQPPLPPSWIEPTEGNQNIDPYSFKLHVTNFSDPDGDMHASSDFEIWDVQLNQRVWSALGETVTLYRVERGDGTFENSLQGQDHLLYNTNYRARARFISDSQTNNVGQWSQWRNFHTRQEEVFNQSNWSWTARQGYDIERVARNVNLPVSIVAAPDQIYTNLPVDRRPILYFTQLYGQIGILLRDGTYMIYADDLLNYDSFGSLPGAGEMGVTGIYVDPNSGDLFVSMVYYDYQEEVFKGKVDKFISDNNGYSYTSRQTLLSNIPVSPAHQVHTITRGPDGKLYLNTGDADDAMRAKDISFLGGKTLRFNDDGSIPGDNPYGNSYVYASGFRNHFGGDWRPNTNEYYVSHNGPDHNDGMYKVPRAFVGGWCCDTVNGTWYLWPNTVAPTEVEFNKGGNSFPQNTVGHIYTVLSGETYREGQSLRGKRIVEFSINSNGQSNYLGELVTYTGNGYSAPIGVAFRPEGLYFTDIYGTQGFTGVGQTNGNIYRMFPGTQTRDPNEGDGEGELTAAMAPGRWYPQGLNMVWECHTEGGSGEFRYDYHFGDGQHQYNTERTDVFHVYPANGTYFAYCTVHDQQTQEVVDSPETMLVLGQGGGGDNTPPVISNGQPSGNLPPGTRSVIMSVNTNENAQCRYHQQSGQNFNNMILFTQTGQQFHSSNITGLQDGQNYNFYVKCKDNANNVNPNDYQISFSVGGAQCYARVQDIPASCTGGSITQDNFDWCRHITCTSGNNNLRILACNKPGDHNPQYFEMYKESSSGSGLRICLGPDTCISSNDGFDRSPNFPICF